MFAPKLKRVIIHSRTGKSIRGFLVPRWRGSYLLKQAELLLEKGDPIPLDGEVIIESSNVDFIQVL